MYVYEHSLSYHTSMRIISDSPPFLSDLVVQNGDTAMWMSACVCQLTKQTPGSMSV